MRIYSLLAINLATDQATVGFKNSSYFPRCQMRVKRISPYLVVHIYSDGAINFKRSWIDGIHHFGDFQANPTLNLDHIFVR